VIPLHLKLSGFLSYCDPVELDFTGFDLACISGSNGSGKSSLLDAMTWALFGQARKRDESVINLQAKAAEVSFTFAYETNVYRVIRSLQRGKTTTLEFQIREEGSQELEAGTQTGIADQGTWRPLTEHTLRETQARIEQTLRLDYDTFVNVSFFLQGKADQFAQQPPTRRKEILGNILGLEAWEIYKERAADRRKAVESRLDIVDGRVAEIDAELAEEGSRKATLAELEAQLKGLVASRRIQEETLANIKQVRAALEKQQELVKKMDEAVQRSRANLDGLRSRLAERKAEREPHADLLRRAAEIDTAYTVLQKARVDLEKWDQIAERFREYDQLRQPLLREIESEQARLEEERRGLEQNRLAVENQRAEILSIKTEIDQSQTRLAEAEAKVTQRLKLETESQSARERQAELRSENIRLKADMDELKQRIDKLTAAEGVACPLCGQSLTQEHRQSTLELLNASGKQMGDSFRANTAALKELETSIAAYVPQVEALASADADRLACSGKVAQLTERLETIQKQAKEWERGGGKRLAQVSKLLDGGNYALEARKKLALKDKDLAALGYDAVAHDAARRNEVQSRPAEAEFRALAEARSALKPLDNEIANLQKEIEKQEAEVKIRQAEYDESAAALSAAETQAPDFEAAERTLYDLQERENALNQEVGGARQKVTVLDDLRKRKKALESERGELAVQIGRYKTLERAFGKDGVPALLIEQALPEIELKANEILGRLSDDTMHLHFETQAKYKDDKRKDLRETLDIQVSDGAGLRDYELFSGGESFRVNFAIRLALSEVLAQRKGARLQMLVIDEGFGSQDTQGRQRLIQAINSVKGDFAKILVITHLEELKDFFPNRIEVEKGKRGSEVRVI
jgi:exonuclease SbcC